MMNVCLFQPNYNFGTELNEEYFLPYSAGLLWSYVAQQPEIKQNFTLTRLQFKREPIDLVINNLDNPKICAFSCYVWNYEYNKMMAKKIKEKFPECIIVFGGPSVTNRPYEKLFFKFHKYVDVIINGEGEYAFSDLLLDIIHGNKIKKVYSKARINELDSIPSPYLENIFGNIINENPNVTWQAVVETNRGCPFPCTFCDWGSTTYSKIKKFDVDRVINEFKYLSDLKVSYVSVADANFGIFPDRDKFLATEIAKIKNKSGFPKSIGLSWNKNSQLKVLEIAKILGARGFTLSLQSLNDDVLKEIKRTNMEINNLQEMLEKTEQMEIPTYTEIILGLPHETLKSWKQGHYKLMNIGQHGWVDVHLTMLLENSEMNSLESIIKYGIEYVSVENYVNVDNNESVVETINLVKSTNTMTEDDMIESYMFSWFVLIFHYFGYAQIISRYLFNKYNITYEEFYEGLYEHIKASSTVAGKEYKSTKDNISKYFKIGKINKDGNFGSGSTIMYRSLKYLLINSKEMKLVIAEYVNEKFTKLPEGQIQSVLDLQEHFVIDINKVYPYKIDVKADVYNALFNTSFDTETINITIGSKVKFKDVSELTNMLWWHRRSNISKVKITI